MNELNVKGLKARKKPLKKSRFSKAKTRKKKSSESTDEKKYTNLTEVTEGVGLSKMKDFYGSVQWSWKQWIPQGMLTMFVGPQASGKSFLMTSLIAVFTGVEPTWPDGKLYTGETGHVILAETEGMRAEYIERLHVAEIPPNLVRFPIPPDEHITYATNLAVDLTGIVALAKDLNAVAIIVDSLSGGHKLSEKSDEMRLLLQPLSQAAGVLQIPIILVHHPRKKSPSEAPKITIDRARGSSTITQFCRSVVGVYRLVDDLTAPVRMEVVKANLSKPPKPLGFIITGAGPEFTNAPRAEKTFTRIDEAAEFLMEQLADGPKKYTALLKAGEPFGITKGPLYSARERIGVIADTKVGWQLPTIDGKTYPALSRDSE